MNLFDVYLLSFIFHRLTVLEQLLLWAKLAGKGAQLVDESTNAKAMQSFEHAEVLFRNSQFLSVSASFKELKSGGRNPSWTFLKLMRFCTLCKKILLLSFNLENFLASAVIEMIS